MARAHRPPPRLDWAADDFEEEDVPVLSFLAEEQPETDDGVADGALGQGRFAVVYHRRTPSGRDVALKRVRRPSHQTSAQNEANLLRGLQHPNVVKLMAVISEENNGEEESQWGSVNLLQELVGLNLHQFIEQNGRTELGATLVINMCKDIGNALLFLYNNCIVHHDIKPQNLLPDRYGELSRVLWDRQVALLSGHDRSGDAAKFDATINGKRYTIKVDTYSAGVVFWVMLTGQPPFAGETNSVLMISRIRNGGNFPCPSTCMDGSPVPAGLARLIDQMVEVDPAQRVTANMVVDLLATLAP